MQLTVQCKVSIIFQSLAIYNYENLSRSLNLQKKLPSLHTVNYIEQIQL